MVDGLINQDVFIVISGATTTISLLEFYGSSDKIKHKRLNFILLLCTYHIISIFLIFCLKHTKYCWYYHLIIFTPTFMPSCFFFFFFTISFYMKICLPFLIQIPSSHHILFALCSENAFICLLKGSFFNLKNLNWQLFVFHISKISFHFNFVSIAFIRNSYLDNFSEFLFLVFKSLLQLKTSKMPYYKKLM